MTRYAVFYATSPLPGPLNSSTAATIRVTREEFRGNYRFVGFVGVHQAISIDDLFGMLNHPDNPLGGGTDSRTGDSP